MGGNQIERREKDRKFCCDNTIAVVLQYYNARVQGYQKEERIGKDGEGSQDKNGLAKHPWRASDWGGLVGVRNLQGMHTGATNLGGDASCLTGALTLVPIFGASTTIFGGARMTSDR